MTDIIALPKPSAKPRHSMKKIFSSHWGNGNKPSSGSSPPCKEDCQLTSIYNMYMHYIHMYVSGDAVIIDIP